MPSKKTYKIVVTGPESSGKTTLAKTLAKKYNAPFVEEVVREYLSHLGRKHKFEDLEKIARLQQQAINEKNDSLVFCDTDLLTIKIWAEDKYNKTIDGVEEMLLQNSPDLYILCFPDLPWEPDPLREDMGRLDVIYKKYLSEIKASGVPFIVAKGLGDARLNLAVNYLNDFLNREG